MEFLLYTQFPDKNIFKQNNHDLTMDKRGQELSTNAIIMIVLGVLVLVVLILGFTMGWGKILPFISSNNVGNVKSACQTACETDNMYDFCTLSRTLKASDLPLVAGKKPKSVDNTCTYFATTAAFLKYGIADCPGICTTTP
jgi:hypothetical protein